MILSQAAKYGIRAVLYLAQNDPGPLLSRDIATALDIPAPFLARILQDLAKNNLLSSFKGRGGGFKLARPADAIKLLDVVQAIEGRQFGEGCVLGLGECLETNHCPLHYKWTDIKEDILGMMREKSVKELLEEASLRSEIL